MSWIKHGLEGIAKEVYRKARKKAFAESAIPKELYRWDISPKALVKRGMQDPLRYEKEVGEWWKPDGLYLAFSPKDIPGLLTGSSTKGTRKDISRYLKDFELPHLLRSVVNTKKVLRVPTDEHLKTLHQKWSKLQWPDRPWPPAALAREDKKEWTAFLKKHFDAVWQDSIDGVPGRRELIVVNPKRAKLFFKNMKWPIIVGGSTIGAMQIKDMATPDDVEAGMTSWIGKEQIKAITKSSSYGVQSLKSIAKKVSEAVVGKNRVIGTIDGIGKASTANKVKGALEKRGFGTQILDQTQGGKFPLEGFEVAYYRKRTPAVEEALRLKVKERKTTLEPEEYYTLGKLFGLGGGKGVKEFSEGVSGKPLDVSKAKEALKKVGYTSALTGALIGGSLLVPPEEAEAGLITKILPAGSKATKKLLGIGAEKGVSRSVERLVGQQFNGKTVKDVLIGKGNWRTIVYDDGTTQAVQKDVIADLSRALGTKKYTKDFYTKEAIPEESVSALNQAIKSLEYHYKRRQPFTRESIRDFYKAYKKNVQAMDPNAMPNLAAVDYKGNYLLMPREYAEVLEAEGYLKMVEGTREKMFKPKPKPSKSPKYDFGGAEQPYEKGYTIVDKMPEKEYKSYVKDFPGEYWSAPYKQQDITKPFSVTPGSRINVSKVLRYEKDRLEQVVSNVVNNLTPGGTVRLFDYENIVDKAIPLFEKRGFRVIRKEMVNPAMHGSVSEWLVYLKKGTK